MSEPTSAGAMPVSAYVGDTVARIAPEATLFDVADALAAGEVGVLVVGDGDRPDGIVSERDVVGAFAGRLPLDETSALDIATTELVWCDAAATVADVAEEMCERYVRHVLVEDDGRLIGVVSARDLLGVYAAADMDREP